MGFSFRSVDRIVINLTNRGQRPVIIGARHFVRHRVVLFFRQARLSSDDSQSPAPMMYCFYRNAIFPTVHRSPGSDNFFLASVHDGTHTLL